MIKLQLKSPRFFPSVYEIDLSTLEIYDKHITNMSKDLIHHQNELKKKSRYSSNYYCNGNMDYRTNLDEQNENELVNEGVNEDEQEDENENALENEDEFINENENDILNENAMIKANEKKLKNQNLDPAKNQETKEHSESMYNIDILKGSENYNNPKYKEKKSKAFTSNERDSNKQVGSKETKGFSQIFPININNRNLNLSNKLKNLYSINNKKEISKFNLNEKRKKKIQIREEFSHLFLEIRAGFFGIVDDICQNAKPLQIKKSNIYSYDQKIGGYANNKRYSKNKNLRTSESIEDSSDSKDATLLNLNLNSNSNSNLNSNSNANLKQYQKFQDVEEYQKIKDLTLYNKNNLSDFNNLNFNSIPDLPHLKSGNDLTNQEYDSSNKNNKNLNQDPNHIRDLKRMKDLANSVYYNSKYVNNSINPRLKNYFNPVKNRFKQEFRQNILRDWVKDIDDLIIQIYSNHSETSNDLGISGTFGFFGSFGNIGNSGTTGFAGNDNNSLGIFNSKINNSFLYRTKILNIFRLGGIHLLYIFIRRAALFIKRLKREIVKCINSLILDCLDQQNIYTKRKDSNKLNKSSESQDSAQYVSSNEGSFGSNGPYYTYTSFETAEGLNTKGIL